MVALEPLYMVGFRVSDPIGPQTRKGIIGDYLVRVPFSLWQINVDQIKISHAAPIEKNGAILRGTLF